MGCQPKYNNQGVRVDNDKEMFYIQITVDGLIKVSEDVRSDLTKKISRLVSELLELEGMISSKSNITVISELEVSTSVNQYSDIN
jgi:hypothetical protein